MGRSLEYEKNIKFQPALCCLLPLFFSLSRIRRKTVLYSIGLSRTVQDLIHSSSRSIHSGLSAQETSHKKTTRPSRNANIPLSSLAFPPTHLASDRLKCRSFPVPLLFSQWVCVPLKKKASPLIWATASKGLVHLSGASRAYLGAREERERERHRAEGRERGEDDDGGEGGEGEREFIRTMNESRQSKSNRSTPLL